jgi:alpha-L-fucosidase
MNLSRRKFARVCALTATGRALAGALPSLAQVQGEHINTTTVHPVPAIQDTETPEQKSDRMQWFREARFGMFIHWGLYSILAGRRTARKSRESGSGS